MQVVRGRMVHAREAMEEECVDKRRLERSE